MGDSFFLKSVAEVYGVRYPFPKTYSVYMGYFEGTSKFEYGGTRHKKHDGVGHVSGRYNYTST